VKIQANWTSSHSLWLKITKNGLKKRKRKMKKRSIKNANSSPQLLIIKVQLKKQKHLEINVLTYIRELQKAHIMKIKEEPQQIRSLKETKNISLLNQRLMIQTKSNQ